LIKKCQCVLGATDIFAETDEFTAFTFIEDITSALFYGFKTGFSLGHYSFEK
jgi:hypothetical protein